MVLLGGVAVLVCVADQATKAWALARLHPGRPTPLIPGLVDLTLVLNPGVAFGMLAGVPPGWRWVVSAVSVAALVMLCVLGARVLAQEGRLGRMALALVFGGAAGNLVDRWRFGAVVDFIDLHWQGYHWPAFNLADSAITVGVALLAAGLTLGARRGRALRVSGDPGA